MKLRTKQGWPIGACSWSFRQDLTGIAESMKKLGLTHIHLAVGPGVGKDQKSYVSEVLKQKWVISCAMIDFPGEDYSSLESIKRTGGIAPDAEWLSNKARFARAAEVTSLLGVKQLSMHAGFLDHNDKKYARKFRNRILALADIAGKRNLELLLETGQESAVDLRDFLENLDHPLVNVNFDPANMILYDKDQPISAVAVLGPWIRHVHIKDAVRTKTKGQWGAEVPWGSGEVGGNKFLAALKQTGFNGYVAIEREAGSRRLSDIATAVRLLRSKH